MNKIENSKDINNCGSFNFKRFKVLKKRIRKIMDDKYWEDVTKKILWNKEIKEAFYKFILWFPWYKDVFNSWRKKDISEFKLDKTVEDVIYEVKNYVIDNIYNL